jgi:hypothetical protein
MFLSVSYPSLHFLVFIIGNMCRLLNCILRINIRVKEMFYKNAVKERCVNVYFLSFVKGNVQL